MSQEESNSAQNEKRLRIERSADLVVENAMPRRVTLAECRDLDAYVLLGEPGSGKTVAFEMESAADADHHFYITARDLIELGFPEKAAGKTLFIDALDERRAASSNLI